MPATITYNPPPPQNPAGILRADPYDPWRHSTAPSTAPCPVPPLKGLRETRATSVSYRALAPHGATLPFGISATHSVVPQQTANYSLLTANSSYTFSAKEKDSETGLSYFGSRYYSSDLSIWLSVDPMASKYPSLSPYVYCANNPVKLVDPDGEEIWIVGEDGNKYKYYNGNFYTTDNKLYTPESESFFSTAGNAIDKLKGTTTGNKLISPFEGPNNKDVIIKSGSKSTCDNLTTNPAGEFISQTILWNTEGTEVQTTNGVQKNSTTDLAHELSHVYDNAKKIKGLNDLCTKGGVRSDQKAASLGNIASLRKMGICYYNGYGVKASKRKSFVYLKKAADSGDTAAMTMLISYYIDGEGCRKSWKKCFRYAYKAANQGNESAIKFLQQFSCYIRTSIVWEDESQNFILDSSNQ